MTFDEYRINIIQRIKACSDAAAARALLVEVDLVLLNSRISERALTEFWDALNRDLKILAEGSTLILAPEAAARLTTVIEGARATITQYQPLTPLK